MKRRKFIGRTMAGGTILGGSFGLTGRSNAYAQSNQTFSSDRIRFAENLEIERDIPGQPHKGKVLAVIQEHGDDLTGGYGTVAKLIKEGFTAYIIRITNDMEDPAPTIGQKVVNIDLDHQDLGRVLGVKKIYNLNYRKHHLDDISIHELTGRLIYLFRMLQVDTIMSHNPWQHSNQNPDHTVTGHAVRGSWWTASEGADYPEFLQAGLKLKSVRERYYSGCGPNRDYNFTMCNRVVDISSVIDKKVEAVLCHKHWGPGVGRDFKSLKESYTKGSPGQLGRHFGLEYAETFVYRN